MALSSSFQSMFIPGKTHLTSFQGLFKSRTTASDFSKNIGIIWRYHLSNFLPYQVQAEEVDEPRD